MSALSVKVWKHEYTSIPPAWCYGRYYVGGQSNDGGHYDYLRNDGKKFGSMQNNHSDPAGGTYFLTEQDAQDCLDRYNAAQNEPHTDTKTELTYIGHPLSDNEA